ncbi:MAG: RDD family protein [Bacteroidota bacterium]|nr:RDD family protein [Bacteroidota bacterium]
MHKCPNCNYESQDDFLYCPMCGYYLKSANEEKIKESEQDQAVNTSTQESKKESPRFYKVVNGLFEYPKAPLGKRFGACLIDGLIMFLLSIPAIVLFMIGLSMNPNPEMIDEESFSSGVGLVGGVFTLWGMFSLIFPTIYSFIKDGLKNGQSFGKRFVGLMVIDTQKNSPCKIGKSAFRNLISYLIVAIPFLNLITCWIEPLMVIFREDGKKAADFVASTQVIDASQFGK